MLIRLVLLGWFCMAPGVFRGTNETAIELRRRCLPWRKPWVCPEQQKYVNWLRFVCKLLNILRECKPVMFTPFVLQHLRCTVRPHAARTHFASARVAEVFLFVTCSVPVAGYFDKRLLRAALGTVDRAPAIWYKAALCEIRCAAVMSHADHLKGGL